jgi:hypothetical protein
LLGSVDTHIRPQVTDDDGDDDDDEEHEALVE